MEKWEYTVVQVYQFAINRAENPFAPRDWEIQHYWVANELPPDGEVTMPGESVPPLPEALSRYGAQGWELVGIDSGLLFFKRRRP